MNQEYLLVEIFKQKYGLCVIYRELLGGKTACKQSPTKIQ